MSKNNNLKNFIITIAILLVTALTAESASAYTIESPWAGKAKIRPGQMAGDIKTDSFIDYFIPFGGNSDSLYFLNLNVRTDNQDSNEFNAGFGYRGLYGGDKYILGLNAFLDSKKTALGNRFDQTGLGLEVLTKHFDFRYNYYTPTGKDQIRLTDRDVYSFGPSGLFVSYTYEEAISGFDIEAGVLVPFISDIMETRLYGGTYKYASDLAGDGDLDGKKFRLELRPSNLLTVNFEQIDDKDADKNNIAGAYLNLPFSIERLISGENPFSPANEEFTFFKGTRNLRDRMTDKVVRDRDIITNIIKEDLLRDVKDIIYVNSDNAGGDGTADNPYESFDLAMTDSLWGDNTIIYITSSDTIADTYVNNITLSNGMEVWSSSYLHPIYNLGGSGADTIIDGSTGTIITLADDNSIVGITLSNGDFGIFSDGVYDSDPLVSTMVYTTLIAGNDIQNMTNSAISITNSYLGASDVDDIVLNYHIQDNILSFNGGGFGLYLSTILDTTGYSRGNTFTYNVSDNIIENNLKGVLNNTYLKADKTATGNYITNSYVNNIVNLNTVDSITVNSEVETDANYTITTGDRFARVSGEIKNTFTGNTITDNGNGIVIGDNGFYNNLTVNNQSISGNINLSTDATITNYFKNNIVTGNGSDGIKIAENHISSAVSLTDSTITSSINVDVSGQVTNYFNNNTVGTNGGNAVRFTANLIEAKVNATGANTAGSNIVATVSGSDIANTFYNNTTNTNTEDGIRIDSNIIYANIDGSVSTTGDIMTDTSNTTIVNSFTGNTSSINTLNGIYIGSNLIDSTTSMQGSNIKGNIVSTSANAKIENSFSGNITNTNDFGIQIETNYIYSAVEASTSSVVTGNITATTNNSSIINTISSNESLSNNEAGIIVGDLLNSSSGNTIYAYATADSSVVSMTNSTGGSVNAFSRYSAISNYINGNTSNLNGASGIEIFTNSILSNTDIGVNTTINGDTNSSVQQSSIINSLSSNATLNNSDDGINLRDNQLRTYHSEDASSTISGTTDTIVSDSTIDFVINYNYSNGNLNDGLYIATTAVPSLTGSTTINIDASGNEIESNNRYGVFLANIGSAIYDGNINTNSIAGNVTFDLNNQTGESITAENNWWGSATPNFAAILNGDPIDYDPWRTSE